MQRRWVQIVRFVLLVVGSLVFLLPLIWMVVTALKPVDQTMSMPPQWVPRLWTRDAEGQAGDPVGVHVERGAFDAAKTYNKPQVEAFFAYQWVIELEGQVVPVRLGEEGGVTYHAHWTSAAHDNLPVRLLEPMEGKRDGDTVRVYVMATDGLQYPAQVQPRMLTRVLNTDKQAVEQSYSLPYTLKLTPDQIRRRDIDWDNRDKLAFTHTEMRSVSLESLSQSVVPRWGNFAEAIHAMKYFPRYLWNTLLLCVLTVIGTTLSSAVVAYGFSRIDWPGRDKVFLIVLATMMIPFPVTMVPLYGLFRELGWIGTLRPLWVPAFFATAFNVFLLRQFFRTIPKELSEAARIDGCSEFRIFVQIVLPLAKPALTVVALFQFMATWNDFLGPLIYLTDQKDFTLALGLQFFQSQHGGTPWHLLMAASTLIVIPVVLLFFLAQRTFIEGVSMSGLKG